MKNNFSDSTSNSYLMKKILAVCPICKKIIYGKDIHVEPSEVNDWPVPYIHRHSHNGYPMHDLLLYIDVNLAVRSYETLNL